MQSSGLRGLILIHQPGPTSVCETQLEHLWQMDREIAIDLLISFGSKRLGADISRKPNGSSTFARGYDRYHRSVISRDDFQSGKGEYWAFFRTLGTIVFILGFFGRCESRSTPVEEMETGWGKVRIIFSSSLRTSLTARRPRIVSSRWMTFRGAVKTCRFFSFSIQTIFDRWSSIRQKLFCSPVYPVVIAEFSMVVA
jgi:hypothetical protein